MPMEFDWSVIEKGGIAVISVTVIYFGYHVFRLVVEQWKNSTDAVNKNTEAFLELSKVFERSHEREVEFQKEALEILRESHKLNRDTNIKVREIHDKIIEIEE